MHEPATGQGDPASRTRADLRKRWLNNPRRRRGAAAVEFAVVAPILLIMIFGMIDFGRMIMVQQLLNDAAREGARTAVVGGSSAADVAAGVAAMLDATSIRSTAVTIDVTPSNLAGAQRGQLVVVQLSVPFRDVCWLPTPRAVGDRTLRATATMRHE
jgi:Flp pilus assembly protein TadG